MGGGGGGDVLDVGLEKAKFLCDRTQGTGRGNSDCGAGHLNPAHAGLQTPCLPWEPCPASAFLQSSRNAGLCPRRSIRMSCLHSSSFLPAS